MKHVWSAFLNVITGSYAINDAGEEIRNRFSNANKFILYRTYHYSLWMREHTKSLHFGLMALW